MAKIVKFIPKSQFDAETNLRDFIRLCKYELTVFGEDLDWDRFHWPNICTFAKLGKISRTDPKKMLDKNFIEFARAYLRYQRGHSPKVGEVEMPALRAAEAALISINKKPIVQNIDHNVLNIAVQIAQEHYSVTRTFHVGTQLVRLAKFITEHNLSPVDLSSWTHSIRCPDAYPRTNEAGLDLVNRKMPSEEAIMAIAEIFSNSPIAPRDIFTSSVCALLMSAPSRISEVLELNVNCEVEEIDSSGQQRYGLRFHSKKGFGSNIKWIPTEMTEVAREAIRRIRKLTSESRKLAEHMEKAPDKFYRHMTCPDVREDTPLTVKQVCLALGLVATNERTCKVALRGYGLEFHDGVYTLANLQKTVKKRLPDGFPWFDTSKKLRFSDALFCMNAGLLHSRNPTSPVVLWQPNRDTMGYDLSSESSAKDIPHKSVFDRNGYKASDGKSLKLKTHQFRHLLNTFAQRGGLSQLYIAKWSGRVNTNQNRVYNHMSDYELVDKVKSFDLDDGRFVPNTKIIKHDPITVSEFKNINYGPVHVTEYGICTHDFVLSPCEKYRDCINCTEQVCVKGDDVKLERIKNQLSHIELQFEASRKALEQGLSGADRWYEYHEKALVRLKELVKLLESPDLEPGSLIKLRNGDEFSPLRRALESKTSLSNKSEDLLSLEMLEELRKL